jgi:hypothetical protein
MFVAGRMFHQGFVRIAAGCYGHQGCIFMYGRDVLYYCLYERGLMYILFIQKFYVVYF